MQCLGSAIATSISDIPFDGPMCHDAGWYGRRRICHSIRTGSTETTCPTLQLTVASTTEKVIMIEAGANEVPEEKMIEAIYAAHEMNQTDHRVHR